MGCRTECKTESRMERETGGGTRKVVGAERQPDPPAGRIYFTADVHLDGRATEESRRKEQRFVAWLDRAAADAEAIILLGDIFDFWYEYRRVVPKGCVRTLAKLAELTERGIRVVLFTGNHDMWVRDYFQQECGIELYTSPQVLELKGQRIFLAHGDHMGLPGEPRLLNAVFRSRVLRWLFSTFVHPDLALRFGLWWSGRSRQQHAAADAQPSNTSRHRRLTEPLVEWARRYAREQGVERFLFGHLHTARDCREEHLRVLFLNQWNPEPSWAVMEAGGEITLEPSES